MSDDPRRLAADASGADPGSRSSATAGAAEQADAAAAREAHEAAEAAEHAAEQAGEPSSLFGALFATDPDGDPADVDGPRPLGEFIVGLRKVISARGVDVGDGSGTPAVINFAKAGIGLSIMVRERDGSTSSASSTSSDDRDRREPDDEPGAGPATEPPSTGPAT